MSKRVICLFLALTAALFLCGCAEKADDTGKSESCVTVTDMVG